MLAVAIVVMVKKQTSSGGDGGWVGRLCLWGSCCWDHLAAHSAKWLSGSGLLPLTHGHDTSSPPPCCLKTDLVWLWFDSWCLCQFLTHWVRICGVDCFQALGFSKASACICPLPLHTLLHYVHECPLCSFSGLPACLPAPTSASFDRYNHCPSSGHVQTISDSDCLRFHHQYINNMYSFCKNTQNKNSGELKRSLMAHNTIWLQGYKQHRHNGK